MSTRAWTPAFVGTTTPRKPCPPRFAAGPGDVAELLEVTEPSRCDGLPMFAPRTRVVPRLLGPGRSCKAAE